jgi:hypothetical protein
MPPAPFRRRWNSGALLLSVPLLYAAWLAMMAVHELGHLLHGWLSGATVSAVRIPLAGFSITEFSTNPHPHFVAWGGAVWGCILPLLGWMIFRLRRWPGRNLLQFFAGLCLISNGAYLGVGWTSRAGDAGDLVAYGTPVWVLVTFGIAVTGTGLSLWHLLGRRGSPDTNSFPTEDIR